MSFLVNIITIIKSKVPFRLHCPVMTLCTCNLWLFTRNHVAYLFTQCKQYIGQYAPLIFQQLMSMVSTIRLISLFSQMTGYPYFHCVALSVCSSCWILAVHWARLALSPSSDKPMSSLTATWPVYWSSSHFSNHFPLYFIPPFIAFLLSHPFFAFSLVYRKR